MQATENVDAVYLITLESELRKISVLMNKAQAADITEGFHLYFQAWTSLDQLRVRIAKDVLDMSKQEAADDSEMPLGPIAARATKIEDEVAF